MRGISLILLLLPWLSGCVALQVVGGGFSAISAYYTYQIAHADPVQVETISRDCLLYIYIKVPDETWELLDYETKKAIGENNYLMVNNCPNIDKPE